MMNTFFENTKPGGQLLALGLIFVLFFIISVGGTLVVTLMMTLVSGYYDWQLLSLAVTQIISFGGTALLFAFLFYGKPLRHLGVHTLNGMAIKLLVSCIIIVCLLPMSDWLSRINDAWHLPQGLASFEENLRSLGEKSQEQVVAFLSREGIGALVGNLIVMAFIPAFCEELFFRGALQNLFCRMIKNHHVAIWVTAAVFSLFHGEIFAFLPRFVLGAALGYLFYYGGSLWYSFTAHFLNNAAAIVLFYLASIGKVDMDIAENSINAPWYLAIIGLAVAFSLLYVFFIKPKSTKKLS